MLRVQDEGHHISGSFQPQLVIICLRVTLVRPKSAVPADRDSKRRCIVREDVEENSYSDENNGLLLVSDLQENINHVSCYIDSIVPRFKHRPSWCLSKRPPNDPNLSEPDVVLRALNNDQWNLTILNPQFCKTPYTAPHPPTSSSSRSDLHYDAYRCSSKAVSLTYAKLHVFAT